MCSWEVRKSLMPSEGADTQPQWLDEQDISSYTSSWVRKFHTGLYLEANYSFSVSPSFLEGFTLLPVRYIRFSLARNEVEDLNISLKSIYCLSGLFRGHLKSLLSTSLSPSAC